MVTNSLHIQAKLIFSVALEALLAALQQTTDSQWRHERTNYDAADCTDHFVEADSTL